MLLDLRSAIRSIEWEGRSRLAIFATITVALALLLIMTTDVPFYDRYLVALVPFVAGLMIGSTPR